MITPRPRAIVTAILVIGWAIAAVAWVTAPAPEDDPEVYDLLHSKRHDRDVERLGGKAGLLANDLDDWLASLWEGRNRAYTIAVGTALVAGAYVLLQRAGSRPPDE